MASNFQDCIKLQIWTVQQMQKKFLFLQSTIRAQKTKQLRVISTTKNEKINFKFYCDLVEYDDILSRQIIDADIVLADLYLQNLTKTKKCIFTLPSIVHLKNKL